MFFLVALSACSKPAGTPVETPAPAPAAVAPAPPPPTFPCCDTPAAIEVVDAYVAVNHALAKDDDAAAAAALTRLATAAAAEPTLAGVAAAVGPMAAQDIEAKRSALKPLAPELVAYARAHTGGTTTLSEAFCPMVNAGWIQAGSTISNPYYGAKMLTCGSFR